MAPEHAPLAALAETLRDLTGALNRLKLPPDGVASLLDHVRFRARHGEPVVGFERAVWFPLRRQAQRVGWEIDADDGQVCVVLVPPSLQTDYQWTFEVKPR